MENRRFVNENNKNAMQQRNSFNSLIDTHTRALQKNSESIIDMLNVLSKKKLSEKDKKALKTIKRELKYLDTEIDKIGDYD